jgi:hypothetical protein
MSAATEIVTRAEQSYRPSRVMVTWWLACFPPGGTRRSRI